jgi:hypothetical protein
MHHSATAPEGALGSHYRTTPTKVVHYALRANAPYVTVSHSGR